MKSKRKMFGRVNLRDWNLPDLEYSARAEAHKMSKNIQREIRKAISSSRKDMIKGMIKELDNAIESFTIDDCEIGRILEKLSFVGASEVVDCLFGKDPDSYSAPTMQLDKNGDVACVFGLTDDYYPQYTCDLVQLTKDAISDFYFDVEDNKSPDYITLRRISDIMKKCSKMIDDELCLIDTRTDEESAP